MFKSEVAYTSLNTVQRQGGDVALDRDAIVDAAFDLLAEGGLDAITARALATRLHLEVVGDRPQMADP